MAFTEQDAAALRQWMDEHAPAAACPLCRRAGDWLPGGDNTPFAGGTSAIPLVCRNCGYVLLLSSYVIGRPAVPPDSIQSLGIG
jgi:hypothetical protein